MESLSGEGNSPESHARIQESSNGLFDVGELHLLATWVVHLEASGVCVL